MSPSEPPTNTKDARKRAYASTTHCTPMSVVLNSRCSATSATFTTVPSMNAMLEARIVAANIHGLEVCRQGVAEQDEPRMTPSSQGCLSIPFMKRDYEIDENNEIDE